MIITLALPDKALSPNSRAHWRTVAAKKKALRLEAGWAGKVAWMAAGNMPTPWETAEVRAVFYWPDKRRRDKDNALASLKAAFDGLQDAGVIADDSGFSHKDPVFLVDKEWPRVEIEVSRTQKGLINE